MKKRIYEIKDFYIDLNGVEAVESIKEEKKNVNRSYDNDNWQVWDTERFISFNIHTGNDKFTLRQSLGVEVDGKITETSREKENLFKEERIRFIKEWGGE